MKVLVALIVVLLLGCAKEVVVPENPVSPVDAVKQNLASTQHTFTMAYKFGEETVTPYYDNGKIRLDRTFQGRLMRAYVTDKSYLCRQDGDWRCAEVQRSALLFVGVEDPYSPYVADRFTKASPVQTGSRKLADQDVPCFTLGEYTECYGPDGQLFYSEKAGTVEVEVVSYQNSVSSGTFKLPAEPKQEPLTSPNPNNPFTQAINSR